LESLYIYDNQYTHGEVAIMFANALVNNCTLKTLQIDTADIISDGWATFSKLLCDTSSINNTFLSNHTLEGQYCREQAPKEMTFSLDLNAFPDKKAVAINKILKHHCHIDMQSTLGWGLKLLPLVVGWFESADAGPRHVDVIADTKGMRFSAIYQFILGVPFELPLNLKEVSFECQMT
jgi:hypothetical protein